jgi:hypothetical protein
LDGDPTIDRRWRLDFKAKGSPEVTLHGRVARLPFRAKLRLRRSIRAIRTTDADTMHGDD